MYLCSANEKKPKVMRKQPTIDEVGICQEYKSTTIGIEALAKKHGVGKLRIKDVLKRNGIPFKTKGGQNLIRTNKVEHWSIRKYVECEGFHYVAKDKNDGFTTNDYENRAGILTTRIKEVYGVRIPTLYDRRMYYMKTGDYWWEQWFDIIKVKNEDTKKCPYCSWETCDALNRSGAFSVHLKHTHGISEEAYLTEHPEDTEYLKKSNRQLNLKFEKNEDKYVTCKICGKRLRRIDTHHLKIHGLSKDEYISKYGIYDMVCQEYHEAASRTVAKMNLNAPFKKTSKDEKELMEFIESLGFECKSNRSILKGKEIDIYVPELKIGFEYNGCLYHTEDYGKGKNYHVDKTNECEKNGVKLYHIFDDEYHNSKVLVENKVKRLLGKSDAPKIGGRECDIKEITKDDARVFLDRYHIQGFSNSTIYLGAFHQNNLMGVMSFLKNTDDEWTLTRYSTDFNYSFPGLGSKMLAHFKRNHSFKLLKSFADRRYTSLIGTNIYDRLGFERTEILPPDYRYYNQHVNKYKRFHKFNFRKKLLNKRFGLSLELTENEMTEKLGYKRIWDCGLLKYVYRNVV